MEKSAAWTHESVLLDEAVDALVNEPAGRYVDATFGRGGHSRLILSRLSEAGRLLAFDKDLAAQAAAVQIQDARFELVHSSFTALADLPASSQAGVLMDLGVSSPQLDDATRGFSFRNDGPLDMRMDTSSGQSVAEWLNTVEEKFLAEVIREYGEERYAGSVAKAIVARRQARGAIERTSELAEIVAGAVKTREPGKDPATRTFQALRIFINAELEELQQALVACLRVLQPRGRLVVISFHSLEDRIVKQFIAKHARDVVDRRQPQSLLAAPTDLLLKSLGRVKASAAEVERNPRARSAVMRIAERSDAPLGHQLDVTARRAA